MKCSHARTWANFISHCDEGATFHNVLGHIISHFAARQNISLYTRVQTYMIWTSILFYPFKIRRYGKTIPSYFLCVLKLEFECRKTLNYRGYGQFKPISSMFVILPRGIFLCRNIQSILLCRYQLFRLIPQLVRRVDSLLLKKQVFCRANF